MASAVVCDGMLADANASAFGEVTLDPPRLRQQAREPSIFRRSHSNAVYMKFHGRAREVSDVARISALPSGSQFENVPNLLPMPDRSRIGIDEHLFFHCGLRYKFKLILPDSDLL
jgi:hypothetical protein